MGVADCVTTDTHFMGLICFSIDPGLEDSPRANCGPSAFADSLRDELNWQECNRVQAPTPILMSQTSNDPRLIAKG